MSDLRIKILEKNVRTLGYQLDEIEDMFEAAKNTLKKAYMDDDASLKEEDAEEMVCDIN